MRRNKDLEDSVKKQSNKLMTFRAFSIGVSAALLALACGSDSGSSDNNEPEDVAGDIEDPTDQGGPDVEPVAEPPRESCDDNPLLATSCGARGRWSPAGRRAR